MSAIKSMSKWSHLRRAPITEALVDLRVDLPEETTLDQLEALHDDIREAYPKKAKKVEFQGSFQFAGADRVQTDAASTLSGFVFKNSDDTQVVQARRDGFTFSRLKPYTNWDDFTSQARTMWNAYECRARPKQVKRVALRYINRLEIPLPVNNINDWILTAPEVAPSLQQPLAGYFMRLLIPFEAQEAKAIITQVVEPGVHTRVLPIIFDIDVFRERPFPPDDTEIWSSLDALRDVKNRVFFGSLTPQAQDLYK